MHLHNHTKLYYLKQMCTSYNPSFNCGECVWVHPSGAAVCMRSMPTQHADIIDYVQILTKEGHDKLLAKKSTSAI